jgi:hypothetical protein
MTGPGAGTYTSANRRPVTFTGIKTVTFTPPWVVGRRVFYNNSALDGGTPGTGPTDDAAIDAAKQALLPGDGPGSFANVTSYSRGINGIMIDVASLPDAPVPPRDNFEFAVPSDADPSGWSPAPDPVAIVLRKGAGLGGSDRLVITFPDGAVRDTWLRVTVRNTARTGLPAPDVFYFGNLVGDTGGAGASAVDARDVAAVRRNLFSNDPVALSRYDFNRDGKIDLADLTLSRSNQGRRLPPLPAAAEVLAPAAVAQATARHAARPPRRTVLDF